MDKIDPIYTFLQEKMASIIMQSTAHWEGKVQKWNAKPLSPIDS